MRFSTLTELLSHFPISEPIFQSLDFYSALHSCAPSCCTFNDAYWAANSCGIAARFLLAAPIFIQTLLFGVFYAWQSRGDVSWGLITPCWISKLFSYMLLKMSIPPNELWCQAPLSYVRHDLMFCHSLRNSWWSVPEAAPAADTTSHQITAPPCCLTVDPSSS